MVGERIKQYLNDNGIRMSFVTEKVGIPSSQFSDICNKGRKIDCVTYYKICKALNVPLEKFLEDEEAS